MARAETTTAVVVVYRDGAEPAALLRQLAAAVGRVLLVDNARTPRPELARTAEACGAAFFANHNRGGLAGAYNRAVERIAAGPVPPEHLVFLDEDSDAAVLPAFLADAANRRLLADPGVAAVAPAYRDRATGLRGKYIRLSRWRLRYLSRSFATVEPVAFVINSMAVWRWPALQRLGPFDEGLAIDHVDTEMCLRARRAGLQVVVNGAHEFVHAIGERRAFRFLGREMQAGGHPPWRRRLIGRNTAWLARCHLWREPAFAFLCATRLAYEVVGILRAEDDAGAKLRALLGGVWQGLVARRLRWSPP